MNHSQGSKLGSASEQGSGRVPPRHGSLSRNDHQNGYYDRRRPSMRTHTSRSSSLGTANYEQYFTKANVGDLLIQQLTIDHAAEIVELGAGRGSLLAAARRRWGTARLTSVDIDDSLCLAHLGKNSHRHVISNVLAPSFLRSARFPRDAFDAAVCNPPYHLTAWSPAYRSLLRQVGLQEASTTDVPLPADLIFLAHNLRLVKAGGQVGIIVPDGTVTGERSRRLREALIDAHALHSVIELPERTFTGTDAKTHILTLEKGASTLKRIPLYAADTNAQVGEPIYISPEEAVVRMDHRFYDWQRHADSTPSKRLGDCRGLEILRGTWNATAAAQAGLKVLHSTDISSENGCRTISLPNKRIPAVMKDAPIARPGDVVITRVGRHLENKIARIVSGSAVISDCLYIVRAPTNMLNSFWSSLTSPYGRAWLLANSRGVCAKVLNRSALLDFPIRKGVPCQK